MDIIPPGGKASLTVVFDPNYHEEPLGRFSRSVFVETGSGEETEATIWVDILEGV